MLEETASYCVLYLKLLLCTTIAPTAAGLGNTFIHRMHCPCCVLWVNSHWPGRLAWDAWGTSHNARNYGLLADRTYVGRSMERHMAEGSQRARAPLHEGLFPEEEEEDHADPMDCDTDDDQAEGAGPSQTVHAARGCHDGGGGDGSDNDDTPAVPFAYPSKEDIANWRKNCSIQKSGQGGLRDEG